MNTKVKTQEDALKDLREREAKHAELVKRVKDLGKILQDYETNLEQKIAEYDEVYDKADKLDVELGDDRRNLGLEMFPDDRPKLGPRYRGKYRKHK